MPPVSPRRVSPRLRSAGLHSLRDHFAAHALQGALACPSALGVSKTHPRDLAAYAYQVADAMLTHRHLNPPPPSVPDSD